MREKKANGFPKEKSSWTIFSNLGAAALIAVLFVGRKKRGIRREYEVDDLEMLVFLVLTLVAFTVYTAIISLIKINNYPDHIFGRLNAYVSLVVSFLAFLYLMLKVFGVA